MSTITDVASKWDVPSEPLTPEQRAVNELVEAGFVKDLWTRIEPGELQLSGPGGFIPALLKAALEAGLQVELADYLGYDKGDPAGRGSSNVRNGTTPKTVLSEGGPVPLDIPRDRAGTFDPSWSPRAPGAWVAGGTT